MVKFNDLTTIGRISRTHGIDGELVFVADGSLEALGTSVSKDSFLFFDIESIAVPYEIESVRRRGYDSLLIKLLDCDSEIQAVAFVGKDVFVESQTLPRHDDDGDILYIQDLVGYRVFDGNNEIGIVTDVDDTTDNVLLIVRTPDTDNLLLPVADDLIRDVDTETQILTMDLPTGLW